MSTQIYKHIFQNNFIIIKKYIYYCLRGGKKNILYSILFYSKFILKSFFSFLLFHYWARFFQIVFNSNTIGMDYDISVSQLVKLVSVRPCNIMENKQSNQTYNFSSLVSNLN